MKETIITVALIDDKKGRAAILEQALSDAGYQVVCKLSSQDALLKEISEIQPDMIIIDLESPSRDILESLSELNAHNPKPIVMFTEDQDDNQIAKAIKAGVSAYIVDGLQSTRVKPILEVAIARFREFQALRNELKKTQDKLADRKDIERAKGLFMKHKNLTEEKAYQTLRKMAMDKHQKLGDVARNVISVLELL